METWRACEHLCAAPKGQSYRRFFTGAGLHYDLACRRCCQGEPCWAAVSEEEFRGIEDEGHWEGIAGQPELRRTPSGQTFCHARIRLSQLDATQVKVVLPLAHTWLLVTVEGTLLEVEFSTQASHTVATALQQSLDFTLHLSGCVSPDETLVALYETRGRKGLVLERDSGKVLFTFQRGEYDHEISPFGVAFCEHEGRTLLIHTTDWNRLDITDPRTGELRTQRGPTSYTQGEARPERYLDYFHGALYPSPDGTWIADDGWVWHPVGEVASWSLRHWLTENVWESEEGPTRGELCWRAYFWGGPLCWIDSTTLAVWGYGNDDEWLLPAVRLFDVEKRVELRWFPGPLTTRDEKAFWEPTVPFHEGWMVYDGVLFACSLEHGVSVWDTDSGAWLCDDGSFYPVAYQRETKTFLTLGADGAFQLSRLVA